MIAGFNLAQPAATQFMLTRMNTLSRRGDQVVSAHVVVQHLLQAQPDRAFEWLLDHYGSLFPAGRRNVLKSVLVMRHREPYELAASLLADEEVIVNRDAMHRAPRPYAHLRVCDYAFNALAHLVIRETKVTGKTSLPAEMPKIICPSIPIEKRDHQIRTLQEWWARHSGEVLEGLPSLAKDNPSLKSKLQALLNKASADQPSK